MIEVGEYVRVDGKIGKVLGFCECDECQRRGYLEPIIDNINIYITKYDKENGFEGIKHSPNIIDLIEVGDIVKVLDIDWIRVMKIEDEDYLEALKEDIEIRDYKLLSIVTKEQFASMEYKVKEKQMNKWKINIWQYHNVVDSYENNNIEEVLKWFRQNWLWSYDNGNCAFEVCKNNNELTFDEKYDLGFYEDDY